MTLSLFRLPRFALLFDMHCWGYRAIWALLPIGAIGCYGYYAPLNSELSGREIQLALTDSGSVVLAPRVGYAVVAVEGKLLADSAGLYEMSVVSTQRRDGQESGWKGERVEIPHSLVSTLSERRFSRARTSLFAGAVSVGLVVIKHIFGGAGGSNAPGGIPGGPSPR